MNGIKLTLVNESDDRNKSDILIFQKNEAYDFNELAVAWIVITGCPKGFCYSFSFPTDMTISALDAYGQPIGTPLKAVHGQLYSANKDDSGYCFKNEGKELNNSEIQIRNNFERGSVYAKIQRDGKLLGVQTNIIPGQTAAFQFKQSLWIGVASSKIQEGSIINSAIISEIDTELDLSGITEAIIEMTGGGSGANSTPFQFKLRSNRCE